MPTEAAAGVVWAKWSHIFAGALGIAAIVSFTPSMTPAQRVLALLSGMASAIWGTPLIVLALRIYVIPPQYATEEVLESVSGLSGFLLGMIGIYLVTASLRMAETFSKDPWWVIDRLRGKGGK